MVLQRGGGIPLAHILLEGYRLRLAACLNSLDDRHPLRIRTSESPNIGLLKLKKKVTLSKRPEGQMSLVQCAFR